MKTIFRFAAAISVALLTLSVSPLSFADAQKPVFTPASAKKVEADALTRRVCKGERGAVFNALPLEVKLKREIEIKEKCLRYDLEYVVLQQS
jgi:hypothetical protein